MSSTEEYIAYLVGLVRLGQQLGVIDGWLDYLIGEFRHLGMSNEQIKQAIKEASK